MIIKSEFISGPAGEVRPSYARHATVNSSGYMLKSCVGTCLLALIVFSPVIIPNIAIADVVGALMPSKNIPQYTIMHDALVNELQIAGDFTKVILQKPAASQMAWGNAFRKLDVLGARVIVSYGSATAAFAVGKKAQIPVVYVGAYAPDLCGVKGNVTGMNGTVPLEKLIATLRQISGYSKLAILYSSTEADSVQQMVTAEAIALNSGSEVVKIDTHDVDLLDQVGGDAVFDTDFFNLSGAEAVFLTSASNINTRGNIKQIVENSQLNRKATAAILGGTCELGVLVSLSINPVRQGKEAAKMVAEILQGKSPEDIPPNNAPEIEMAINLNTAKKLGLSIPFELLGSARIVK